MKRIRDFIYSYFDFVLILVILALISYTLFTNLTYLLNLSSSDLVYAQEENSNEQLLNVNIPSGINQDQLADILIAYELIEIKDEFLSKVNEQGSVTSINSGQIQLNSNSSIEQLIDILVNY